MHLNREEYRLIKRMSRGELQDYLEEVYLYNTNTFPAVYNAEYPESAFVITDLHGGIKALAGSNRPKEGARESLEKAIDIKGLGPMRKAEIRKKYKKAMEEKEHGRKTGAAGGC